ncbi:MAG: U32 family peptidase C-terminal domain-containing protein, partial [Coriobacteriales bacterium]
SFKIEGRMKSEYYLATVINAYRRALDGGAEPRLEKELSNVAHREYTQGYAFGENRETVNYADSQTKGDYTYIANVLGGSEGFVEAEMRNRFREGDTLEVLSPDDNFGKTFEAKEIFEEGGRRTADAKLVQAKYKISCPYYLKKGDFLRRKNA